MGPTATAIDIDREIAAKAHGQPVDDVLAALDVTKARGLDPAGAARRLDVFGRNVLAAAETESAWRILIRQFLSGMVALLTVAAVLSLVFGDWIDAIAIAAVVLVNAAIGFGTELGAVRSMEALKKLSAPEATVRRGGEIRRIEASKLVPGDIVLLEEGDLIPADIRVIETRDLKADESLLTGESLPIHKTPDEVDRDATLADRSSMLYRSAAVSRGGGTGVVVATGHETEIGRIAELIVAAAPKATPLEERLRELSGQLVLLTLVVCALIAVTGLTTGQPWLLMLQTGIALAVAAVPEGLPIVATLTLARGMKRMAARNVLIRRLAAVETLGEIGVLLTDKTGTLTENRMTVVHVETAAGPVDIGATEGALSMSGKPVDPHSVPGLVALIDAAVLCNDAELDRAAGAETGGRGDPMEIALLVLGIKAGRRHGDLVAQQALVRELAFSREVMMMATVHAASGGEMVAVKGAPEAVIRASSYVLTSDGAQKPIGDDGRAYWEALNTRLAGEGLRVIAVAQKASNSPVPEGGEFADLTLLGLIAIADPPRGGAAEAVRTSVAAGVKVVMLTGDQPVTARRIATDVGIPVPQGSQADMVVHGRDLADVDDLPEKDRGRILEASVFARVTPEQKLDLVALHQSDDHIVAMTGDGVNDAPALKQADIGVAMGLRGADVAREAADIVLLNDHIASIIAAIREGRIVFFNIRAFCLYLLSCNLSEVLVVALATAGGLPLPLMPLQILYLNLVTDVLPAFALGAGPGARDLMQRSPRRAGEPILGRLEWREVAAFGLLMTISVLAAFWIALENNSDAPEVATTVAFLTLATAQVLHVFNMRAAGSGIWRNEVVGNAYVWLALVACAGLIAAAIFIPPFATALRIAPLGAADVWTIAFGAVAPLVVGQIARSLQPAVKPVAVTPAT